jgi:hypothetical protein
VARAHLFRPITNRSGDLLYSATVTVREVNYAIPIGQSLYAGSSGTDELANPFTADNGVIDFWLDTPQRVSILVEAEGMDNILVYLDAQPPPEQIVTTDSPLEIVNSPSVSGQVLLSTSTAGQVQWGNPPSGTGLSPVVVVASQNFATGSDPVGWTFVQSGGATHSYDAGTIPPGTNYLHSLKMTQSANGGLETLTGPTFTLLEAGRVSMWIKSDIAPTETFTVKIVDGASVQTTQATVSQDRDWGFYSFDLAAGTWHSLLTYTGQSSYDGTTPHEIWVTGYVALYGGNVPPHSHSGTGSNSVALGTGSTAGATGSTAVGAPATASGTNATAFGYNASAVGVSALAAGYNASAPTDYSLAVGSGATGSGTATAWTAVGYNTNAGGLEAVAVGKSATVSSDYGVAVGSSATVGAAAGSAVAIGQNASALGPNSLALGLNASVGASHNNSIALGANSATTSANQIMLGNDGALATVLGGIQNYGIASLGTPTSRVGFYGSAGNTIQTVSGSDDGNVTLRTLVQSLANMGLIINNSTQQPSPFRSPVGPIDFFYHQDPGDGSLGVADFDYQPYSYLPLAYSSNTPYPSGPQWFVGSDHNAYKGFASGIGVLKNMLTTKQSYQIGLTFTSTGNRACLALRHTGDAGDAAAAGYLLLDQAANTISFAVKAAAAHSDTYTVIGSPVNLTTIGSTIFDGATHFHIVSCSGNNVMWSDGLSGMPIVWSTGSLNSSGTYVGVDLGQTTTKFNNINFIPQQTWDAFQTTGALVNAPSSEAWWPVLSGVGAAATVTVAGNLQLTGAASGYALAYVLSGTNTLGKVANLKWATGTTPTTSMGLVCRYVDPNNYYFINNSQITRVLAGTQTTLATLSSNFAAGDRMQVALNGTTGLIQVYRNNNLTGSATDTTAALLASNRFGLGIRGTGTANFNYLWVYDQYSQAVTYK